MKLTRRTLLAGLPAIRTARAAVSKTNVVMFMTDDHGAWATGCYGCKDLHTPNVDRLAAGGARFTRAFACTPVCSPSRMTYMTGKLPSRHGVQDWLIPEDSFGPKSPRWLEGQTTYTELLARNGYTLGLSGKWHMGQDDHAQAGFNSWCTVPGGGGPYLDPEFVENGQHVKVHGYKTDHVGDCALDFLERHHNSPFYLLVPFYAPHTPYNYQPEEYRHWYNNSSFSCFPNTPMNPWQNAGLAHLHGSRAAKHAYSALITGMDTNVGRILKKLQDLRVRENTLVVFTADQGWCAGHHGVWGKGNGTWPFNMYEESLHVPLIWNHPGHIRAGIQPPPMISSYDYFPTILEYLGIAAPPDPVRVGRSYAPFLRGENPPWRNRLYFEYEYVRGVRTENLKYIERTREWPSELYDLEDDPGEKRNRLDDPAYRKQRDALRADLTRFFLRNGAPPIEQWHSTTTQHLTVYKAVGTR
ncbi:MAG TPA: sulfatase-like hydrolase/transferase [Bryobacteraceae bacterium]|nr:sulfatase-like hydrolase/transferase [Bryobacteraceae bacterium]